MTNKIEQFLNEKFGSIRAMKDEKGIIWFVAKDVAEVLKYSTTQKVTDKVHDNAILKLPKSQLTNLGNWEQTGGKDVILINESGLYKVTLTITKKDKERYELSEEFSLWITDEVLPTLRQTGGYVEDTREEEFINKYFPSFSDEVKLAMVQDLMKTNKELKVKADGWDKFLDTSSTYSFEETAKLISTKAIDDGKNEFKITTPKLTSFLREYGVLCKDKTTKGYKNLPNKNYEDFFDVVSVSVNDKFNKTQTRVKSTGIKFIYGKLIEEYIS